MRLLQLFLAISMKNNILKFDSPLETANAVAEFILQKAIEKEELNQALNIGLSGGNTPKLLFEVLATRYKELIPWHLVRLFWVDERCVPIDHPESNYSMTYEALLRWVPIPTQNIFRMKGEVDPTTEATRYAKMLQKELPSISDFPQLDIILVGMGDDGHTASIFPNQMQLLRSIVSVSIGTHPHTGQQRITLTGKTLNTAKRLIFIITGDSKATVLRKIIHAEQDCEQFPAYHVHAIGGERFFFLDKAAAALL